jgi:hypothetical protein
MNQNYAPGWYLHLFFRTVLEKLEETEEKERQTRERAKARAKELAYHAEAFVEDLDGDQLFNAMFANDVDGKALLKMGHEAINVYTKYPCYAQDRVHCWTFLMMVWNIIRLER